MAPLSGEWLEALKGEFHQAILCETIQNSDAGIQTHKIFPPGR